MTPRRRYSFDLIAGVGLTGLFLGAALLSLVWTPYAIDGIQVGARFLPPSLSHWLGTDQLGRDLLSLLMAGARNSLLVAVFSTAGSLVAGGALGLWAAARGGFIDALVMRLNDVLFAFPGLVLAILIGAVWGAGVWTAALAIGIFNVPVFARVVRAEAQTLWGEPYLLAGRLAGKGRLRLSLEHVLPQLTTLLVTQCLLQMAFSVAAEAGLSYVGLGAVPPEPSWGRMIAESQTLMTQAPWLVIAPCVAIVLLVVGLSRLSEALKERAAL